MTLEPLYLVESIDTSYTTYNHCHKTTGVFRGKDTIMMVLDNLIDKGFDVEIRRIADTNV